MKNNLSQMAVMNIEEGEEILAGRATAHIPQVGIYKLSAKKKADGTIEGGNARASSPFFTFQRIQLKDNTNEQRLDQFSHNREYLGNTHLSGAGRDDQDRR